METKRIPTIMNVYNNPSLMGGESYRVNQLAREKLLERYRKYIAKHKEIPVDIYFTEDGSNVKEVFYHFMVSSESNDEIVYDVVLNLYAPEHEYGASSDGDFKNMFVKIFSNSPGFTFTYAYVYNRYKLLPEALDYKFSKQVMHTPPLKTNPRNHIGFDSSTFFALTYLVTHPELMQRRNISTIAQPISKFDVTKIPTPEEVMERRSPDDLMGIKRMGRKLKSFINKPKDILFGSKTTRQAKKSSGSNKPLKAKAAIKPAKATKARKPKKAR